MRPVPYPDRCPAGAVDVLPSASRAAESLYEQGSSDATSTAGRVLLAFLLEFDVAPVLIVNAAEIVSSAATGDSRACWRRSSARARAPLLQSDEEGLL